LSQLATARRSVPLGVVAGEKARSEMLSVGGSLRATSFFRSPCVWDAALDALLAAPPKKPDILGSGRLVIRRWAGRSRSARGETGA
jgi:hypothetical protein